MGALLCPQAASHTTFYQQFRSGEYKTQVFDHHKTDYPVIEKQDPTPSGDRGRRGIDNFEIFGAIFEIDYRPIGRRSCVVMSFH